MYASDESYVFRKARLCVMIKHVKFAIQIYVEQE
jgi:hypothetical protein